MHRQMWKVVDHLVSARDQCPLLASALRTAGCDYMAFQVESYFNSKKKFYDGSETLRMTGEDCRLLEENIDKFVQVFADASGFPITAPQNEKIRQVMTMYRLFHDLALDLRSTSGDLRRAKSFRGRVLHFLNHVQKVGLRDCIHRVTYVHLLADHIPQWMVLWSELLEFGYGYFTGSSGEHLNKVVKVLEMTHSNLSSNRYHQILQLMRVRSFHFPNMLLDDSTRDQTCSRCHQKGHNKKNKSCPLHPSHPPPVFSDSE